MPDAPDPDPKPDPLAPPAAAAAVPEATGVLLARARAGDRAAYDQFFARVYQELRRVASRQAARFGRDDSLATTALLNETYLKMAGNTPPVAGGDRVHFFALASRAMRQVLIDHARHERRKKRGGDLVRSALTTGALAEIAAPSQSAADLLALDQALERLAAVDPELAQLVEWRFFGGLGLCEIAELTGRSERTLKRAWQVAKGFLRRELGMAPDSPT